MKTFGLLYSPATSCGDKFYELSQFVIIEEYVAIEIFVVVVAKVLMDRLRELRETNTTRPPKEEHLNYVATSLGKCEGSIACNECGGDRPEGLG